MDISHTLYGDDTLTAHFGARERVIGPLRASNVALGSIVSALLDRCTKFDKPEIYHICSAAITGYVPYSLH